MTRVYKPTFMRKHIDLDKIVTISDAYFIDNMGHGGWFVGFHMEAQLMDEPIRFMRELEDETEVTFGMSVGHRAKLVDGKATKEPQFVKNPLDILAVANLQHDIDGLIQEWKKG